jgi:hypothetical protein
VNTSDSEAGGGLPAFILFRRGRAVAGGEGGKVEGCGFESKKGGFAAESPIISMEFAGFEFIFDAGCLIH